MFQALKKRLYFVVAAYFRFWAAAKLDRWAPKVIVVTGSAGKTTLLHLLEAQLGERARYSHHANSAFGIPFDILGLSGIRGSRLKWLGLLLLAPFKALGATPRQELYVAEVDAERPGEAPFLAGLLKPAVTLWVSLYHTHTAQFDKAGQDPEAAIAREYGRLLELTKELVVINGDDDRLSRQASRTKAGVVAINLADLTEYQAGLTQTVFRFGGQSYQVPALLPKAAYYQVAMTNALLTHLELKVDRHFSHFVMPPGRSNVLAGKPDLTIIDSTYNNSNIDSLREVLELLEPLSAKQKWAVIGDMLEQGQDEAREHAKLAEVLNRLKLDGLVLLGPRTKAHTLPKLDKALASKTVAFESPKEVLEYLQTHLEGGELILFKGARFLEGVIEQLLKDPADAAKLPRREPVWQKRRAEWGV